MLKQSTLTLALVIFIMAVLFLSVAFSITWDKEEGAIGVEEYASDSGSFALLDGLEFTTIWVNAYVQNGQGSTNMTAVAHIQISGGPSVHSEAEATGSDNGYPDQANLGELGYDGCSWYWAVDARNNPGEGTALCKWAWDFE